MSAETLPTGHLRPTAVKKGLPETWEKKPSRAGGIGKTVPSPEEVLDFGTCVETGEISTTPSLAIDDGYSIITVSLILLSENVRA